MVWMTIHSHAIRPMARMPPTSQPGARTIAARPAPGALDVAQQHERERQRDGHRGAGEVDRERQRRVEPADELVAEDGRGQTDRGRSGDGDATSRHDAQRRARRGVHALRLSTAEQPGADPTRATAAIPIGSSAATPPSSGSGAADATGVGAAVDRRAVGGAPAGAATSRPGRGPATGSAPGAP